MNGNYSELSRKLESILKEHLFDQDEAVEILIKTLVQAQLLQTKSRVRALFTFIGPPNTGKHYLPEVLLQIDPELQELKTFHMDQYSGGFGMGVDQLSPVSIESDVIAFVKEYPNSILIFEDIEKADLQVQLSLYALFADHEKSTVDFSQVIVIMTTTSLSSLLQRQDLRELLKNDPLQAHTFLMERLSREQMVVSGTKEEAFDKKLLSLLNEHTLIPFNRLTLSTLIKIGARSLHQMSQNFIKESGVAIEYVGFDTFVSLVTLSLSPYLNARHIRKKVPEVMFLHVYEALKLQDEVTQ
ncbi:MAG: AAA family ATPase, partial [Campylobacterota bacterium]|nr:AAA family ATPase [Campylobacterota bacterium]